MKDIVGDLSCADLAKFCQDNDLPVQQLQDKVQIGHAESLQAKT